MKTNNSNQLQESERPVFSVSDLTLRLQRLVEGSFTNIRVQGEVSGLKSHTSGHQYFTIKDADAVIDAVCWRGTKLGTKLEDGMEIIATGRITVYGARSKYQMIVEYAEATGQGALLKLLEERKLRMINEGIFASERKKPLPQFPRIIGVVTSPTGAVIRDILHRITDRYPCHVLVWPVLVQGQGADQQVAKAIDGFNRIPNSHELRPDLIIVARGGGSLEDLWTFNEEAVVYAVARSDIPIISAIGHETDVTLIDFAADKRAPTPTAAAEMALPVISDLWFTLQAQEQRAFQAISRRLEYNTIKLEKLERSLPDPQRIIMDKTQRIDEMAQKMFYNLKGLVHQKDYALIKLAQRLKTPSHSLSLAEQKFRQLSQSFDRATKGFFVDVDYNVKALGERLEQVSYKRTLERGYAIAMSNDGKMIRLAKEFPSFEPALVRFSDGEVSVVKSAPLPRRRSAKEQTESKQGKLL